ncbi:hypothetical protein LA10_09495 [Thermotoga neapolitana LA10]|nr:hypothetical protein LA10_09495 [Thermotoga neapolitana LA10]
MDLTCERTGYARIFHFETMNLPATVAKSGTFTIARNPKTARSCTTEESRRAIDRFKILPRAIDRADPRKTRKKRCKIPDSTGTGSLVRKESIRRFRNIVIKTKAW